jgi:hypothetical protein
VRGKKGGKKISINKDRADVDLNSLIWIGPTEGGGAKASRRAGNKIDGRRVEL